MTIRYRLGRSNTIADVMSRRQISDDAAGEDDSIFVHVVTVFGEADTLKREQETDEVTGSILHSIKDGKWLLAELERGNKFSIVDGILCRQSTRFPNSKLQVVVPKGLRAVIIDQLHTKSGQLGVYKTFGESERAVLLA